MTEFNKFVARVVGVLSALSFLIGAFAPSEVRVYLLVLVAGSAGATLLGLSQRDEFGRPKRMAEDLQVSMDWVVWLVVGAMGAMLMSVVYSVGSLVRLIIFS